MFGWTQAEALGQSMEVLGLVYEEDRSQVSRVMQALLNGGVERNTSLNRNRRKDGEVIWCEWYNSVLRDEQGVLVSVLSLAMDVTDRQALEANLRLQANRLAEADRRKDEFLSMLGHELRNPLAPIRNALAIMELKGDDREITEWARQLIDRQTQHLEHLVDDLLDVARITSGCIRLKLESVDAAAVVREAIESTDVFVRERQHRMEFELPERPLIVKGDTIRLVQVIANLINNSAKYTNAGGVIRVNLAEHDAMACIAVEDNGRGIAPEELPHVFDVFNQGQRSITRAEGGLGLGLTLVKRLVDMHGGEVEAQSAGPGQGSRFVVRLPLEAVEPAAAAAAPAAGMGPHSAGHREPRILLVDDNADVLESLTLALQALGHDVWGISEGGAVLDAVERLRPDAVILDIGLQDIDGVEVARRLARLPQRRGIRVIAFSGYSDRILGTESELFDAHLLKGISLDQLQRALDGAGEVL